MIPLFVQKAPRPAFGDSNANTVLGGYFMKYLLGWILGIPAGIILIWFVVNHL